MPHSNVHISTQPPYFAGCPIGFSSWTDDIKQHVAAIQFSLDGGEHWTEYSTPGVSDLVSGHPFEVYEAPAPSIDENSQSRHEDLLSNRPSPTRPPRPQPGPSPRSRPPIPRRTSTDWIAWRTSIV